MYHAKARHTVKLEQIPVCNYVIVNPFFGAELKTKSNKELLAMIDERRALLPKRNEIPRDLTNEIKTIQTEMWRRASVEAQEIERREQGVRA